MRRAVVFAVLAGTTALAGCVGENCQSACRKVYSPDECNIQTPGVEDWTQMYDDCLDHCEFAMRTPGDLGGYDPNERNVTGAAVELENERQAAAWIDCVTEQACERLDEGYCAPI